VEEKGVYRSEMWEKDGGGVCVEEAGVDRQACRPMRRGVEPRGHVEEER